MSWRSKSIRSISPRSSESSYSSPSIPGAPGVPRGPEAHVPLVGLGCLADLVGRPWAQALRTPWRTSSAARRLSVSQPSVASVSTKVDGEENCQASHRCTPSCCSAFAPIYLASPQYIQKRYSRAEPEVPCSAHGYLPDCAGAAGPVSRPRNSMSSTGMGQLRDKPAFHASPTPLTLHALFSCSGRKRRVRGTLHSRRPSAGGKHLVVARQSCWAARAWRSRRSHGLPAGPFYAERGPGAKHGLHIPEPFLRTMVPAGGPRLHRGADEVVRRSKRRRRRLARRCAAAVAHAGGNRLRSTKRISHAQRPISRGGLRAAVADKPTGLRAAHGLTLVDSVGLDANHVAPRLCRQCERWPRSSVARRCAAPSGSALVG